MTADPYSESVPTCPRCFRTLEPTDRFCFNCRWRVGDPLDEPVESAPPLAADELAASPSPPPIHAEGFPEEEFPMAPMTGQTPFTPPPAPVVVASPVPMTAAPTEPVVTAASPEPVLTAAPPGSVVAARPPQPPRRRGVVIMLAAAVGVAIGIAGGLAADDSSRRHAAAQIPRETPKTTAETSPASVEWTASVSVATAEPDAPSGSSPGAGRRIGSRPAEPVPAVPPPAAPDPEPDNDPGPTPDPDHVPLDPFEPPTPPPGPID